MGDSLWCPLCVAVLDNPLVAQCCGGKFCEACINEHLSKGKGQCPSCGADIVADRDLAPLKLEIDSDDAMDRQTKFGRKSFTKKKLYVPDVDVVVDMGGSGDDDNNMALYSGSVRSRARRNAQKSRESGGGRSRGERGTLEWLLGTWDGRGVMLLSITLLLLCVMFFFVYRRRGGAPAAAPVAAE